MIAVNIKMVQAVQDAFAEQIEEQYKQALENLETIDQNTIKYAPHRTYLNNLIQVFQANENIIVAGPTALEELMKDFGKLPSVTKKDPQSAVEARKAFLNKIHTALNYKGLRTTFYPAYFAKIGIKACVYCNSQLAIAMEKEQGAYSARFDVDHHIGKNQYPGLAISLFNLYPSCAPCNRRKSEGSVRFKLYSNDEADLLRSSFVFKLDAHAKAKYLLSPKTAQLGINLINRKDAKDSAHEKFFGIDSIYRTQADVAQELLIKSQAYDQAYKQILFEKFSGLGITRIDIERLLIGNYSSEHEIHKRPLSKFVQDLARELGILEL
ncbi:hypothetical protein [Pedobacter sp. BMA]|uniref:hypothetical protein n=1 Tax=Pedobacter sp. BMA TaxID=1663685 RepID=UPI00064AD2E3|nr:hypothetical protein [Pedobacter sp. BMA]KLT63930.1 hypothetical protein AB669_19580 [Pedobacter sp. BMA]